MLQTLEFDCDPQQQQKNGLILYQLLKSIQFKLPPSIAHDGHRQKCEPPTIRKGKTNENGSSANVYLLFLMLQISIV